MKGAVILNLKYCLVPLNLLYLHHLRYISLITLLQQVTLTSLKFRLLMLFYSWYLNRLINFSLYFISILHNLCLVYVIKLYLHYCTGMAGILNVSEIYYIKKCQTSEMDADPYHRRKKVRRKIMWTCHYTNL